VQTPHGTIEGIPLELDDLGGLRVRLADGSIRTVYSAEVGDR
jgi:BirA family biotin operon repressor/biotin-[acetyl-CoA-carboxylase] ligase